MPALDQVSHPTNVIITDKDGKVSAGVSTAVPVVGVDEGLQVYADLGSAPIAVDAVATGAANLTTAQVALNASTATIVAAARATRRCVFVMNISATITIYWGASSGVSSSTGVPLAPNTGISIPTNAVVYAISASATPSVAISEVWD